MAVEQALLALVGAADTGAYQINQSLRFNSADSTYLYRTFGSGDRNNWTLSVWVKRAGDLAAADCDIFYGYDGSSSALGLIEFNSGPVNHDQGGTGNGRAETSATLRDPSAWYHIVVSVDYGNATAANRVRIFVNGVQQTLGVNTVTTNDGQINGAWQHRIGARSSSTFNGYMAEMHFIGGTTVTTASDFGETDTITGAWIPKKYSGSYGTNGFYLKFDPAATNGIGHDHSGNGNNFTATGFSTSGTGTDVMSDTPTNNWCTFNPLANAWSNTGSGSTADGNLYLAYSSGNWYGKKGTIAVSSGKWYYEWTNTSGGTSSQCGFTTIESASETGSGVYRYRSDATKINTTQPSYGATWSTAGDIIGVALDIDGGTITFYKNGTSQGTAFSSIPAGTYIPECVIEGAGYTGYANFGQRSFSYTPPSNFKALCTANLPEPTIKKGSKYFDTKLYTANNQTAQTITGLGFSPDLLWFKPRSRAEHHYLYDQVRGAGNRVSSSQTIAEVTGDNSLTAFTSDGFSLGTDGAGIVNYGTDSMVAWAWDANGAGSSNTAGTITSTVSANATAGFSIVTWTGTGADGSYGHGLGVQPSMIIHKRRDSTSDWHVWHKGLPTKSPTNDVIYLNLTNAQNGGNSNLFRLDPTSTLIYTGSAGSHNVNGATYVDYVFSEVAGYSKFGSYTGNGSTDGPFVFCNFRPAWIMIKDSTGSGNSWYISDNKRNTYNVVNGRLMANLSNDESTSVSICDFTSNGFKIRTSDSGWNTSSSTYIFAAFSETAFKYSNAR